MGKTTVIGDYGDGKIDAWAANTIYYNKNYDQYDIVKYYKKLNAKSLRMTLFFVYLAINFILKL